MSEAMMVAAKLYNDPRYLSRSEIRIRNNRMRRERLYRRTITIITVTLFAISLLCLLAVTSIKSDAQKAGQDDYKYYKTISVNTGDTLWTIASENISYAHYKDVNAYIDDIKSVNNMRGNDINQGTSLIIPYYSQELK